MRSAWRRQAFRLLRPAPLPRAQLSPACRCRIPHPAVKTNPAGRTYEIEVPLKLDGARLGDVPIKITADDKLFIDAKLLRVYLDKVIVPEVLTTALAVAPEQAAQVAGGATVAGKKVPGAESSSILQTASQDKTPEPGQLGQEPPSYLPLNTLKERGIDIRYDPQALELEVLPTVDQRPVSAISLEERHEVESETLERPAYVSAYLNMRLAASYVSQSSAGNTGAQAPALDFDGAVRVGPVVLEGEGAFSTGSPTEFAQNYFQTYVLYRRGTRLVYDLPEEAIRFRAGDITPEYAGFQTSSDLLGISAEKSYAQLQPGKSIRPTGAHSFRIERLSNVDIIVDEALFRRIRLAPGNYNLSDLPLRPGANNVKLVIEDDAGARQTLEFTAFSGNELLAPGISEWSVNAGIKSYDQGVASNAANTLGSSNYTVVSKTSKFYGQRDYYFNQPAATGIYRTGIMTALTADANVQADNQVALAGAGFATQTIAGLFKAELAGSEKYNGGPGYAIQLGYGYDKIDWFGPYKTAFHVLGEYRSNDFATVGTFQSVQDYYAYAAAAYSQQLPFDVSAGLSFSYYLLNPSTTLNASDRWEADFTLSKQLWDNVTGSLSAGYGRDQAAPAPLCCVSNQTSAATCL